MELHMPSGNIPIWPAVPVYTPEGPSSVGLCLCLRYVKLLGHLLLWLRLQLTSCTVVKFTVFSFRIIYKQIILVL